MLKGSDKSREIFYSKEKDVRWDITKNPCDCALSIKFWLIDLIVVRFKNWEYVKKRRLILLLNNQGKLPQMNNDDEEEEII